MKNLPLLVATIVAVIIATLLWKAPAELFFRDREARLNTLPTADSYMQQTATRAFDQHGNLSYILHAETGFYYNSGDRFELKQPKLTAQRANDRNGPWKITADSAESIGGDQRIFLTGNVHAWQTVNNDRNEFHTDDIRYSPRDNIATTKAAVKLIAPEGVTTGTGMRADFKHETYRILGEVRGYYHVR